jgi:hypothetical protein
MSSDPWYAEMAARYRATRTERLPVPPDGPTPDDCDECYRWQYDLTDSDGTDRWLWFKVCGWGCAHEHHEKDVWLARVG